MDDDTKRELSGQIRKTEKALLRYIRRLTGDLWTAEDLLQETYLICSLKYRSLYQKEKFLGWTKTIARNLFLKNRAVASGGDSLAEESLGDDRVVNQVEKLLRDERISLIMELMDILPEKQRMLAVKYYILGLPREAICRDGGISLQVFDSRLFRARSRMKRYVNQRHRHQSRRAFINQFYESMKGEYTMDEFRMEFAENLTAEMIDREDNLKIRILNMRQRFREDYALKVPRIHIKDNGYLKQDEYLIYINEKREKEGILMGDHKLSDLMEILSGELRRYYGRNETGDR